MSLDTSTELTESPQFTLKWRTLGTPMKMVIHPVIKRVQAASFDKKSLGVFIVTVLYSVH